MGQVIDGKAVAARMRADVAQGVLRFWETCSRAPGLAVVRVGDDPASATYVRSKDRAAQEVGFDVRTHDLPATIPEAVLLRLVADLNADPGVDGILVQLPLPAPIAAERILFSIDPAKDVDGLHPLNAGRLFGGRPGLRPCTPLGVLELLSHVGCSIAGKEAVIVGRSLLVGRPVAMMLLEQHATVTLCHSRTRDLAAVIARADIVVAALGRAEMIRGSWIKAGAVVIDVGINRRADGSLVGDVEFAAAREVASYITPVPGGVGPMTVAMLLKNTLSAAQARTLSAS